MELPYKISISNSFLVQVGYTSLMLVLYILFSWFTMIHINLNKHNEVIEMIVIILSLSIGIGVIIYRLFTKVVITDDSICIKRPLLNKNITKSDIIGYQGGLDSYKSSRFFFTNYFYLKYVFTEYSRDVIYIEDNNSAKYFEKNDQKRSIEVGINVENKIKNGLYIKPNILSKIFSLGYLNLITACMFSIWSLSLNKIGKLDSNILLIFSSLAFCYGIGNALLNIYVFVIKKMKIVIRENGIEVSDRWNKKTYDTKEIRNSNKKIIGIRYNSLLRIIVGNYLFNGNQFITDKVFG